MSSLPSSRPYTAVMIVPTGVGARIGGFAGDALPAARLLASVADVLITHPNVMNGAMMYWPQPNILYVEGYALNEFCRGRIHLEPVTKGAHRIGVIFDREMDASLRLRHLQVIDAARATLGIDVAQVAVTSRALDIQYSVAKSGAAWGSVEQTASLVDAGRYLQSQGCTAIALIGRFPEETEDKEAAELFEKYKAGQGVDNIAGVEAILSHILSKTLCIPCAHAPAFSPSELDPFVSPKACAEEIGYTFLLCVLANLHRAPRLVKEATVGSVGVEDVDVAVVPYNALGGPGVLALLDRGKLVIAVKENETAMTVTSSALPDKYQSQVIEARSYAEAAGLLAAHKAGIWPTALTAQVPSVPVTELE